VLWWGSALPDQKMAIHDARVSSGGAHFVLELAEYTKVVYIPDDEEGDMFKFKEVTAGVGGIGMAAKHLGFQCLALMDINQMVCETLAANGHYNVIQGDVLIPQDRFRLHECHNARRGWLFSGFPCQPLSTQGDQKGEHDERAKVFFAVIKTAWEQQVKGLLLECVPAALTAPFVQDTLQQLGWSLGLEICQTTLTLSNFWPNKRTRWWALLVPKIYSVGHISNLPMDTSFQHLQDIFARWPIWSDEEERELEVSDLELEMFHNKAYGGDVRLLQVNQPVPCLLHSYGAVLSDCPCGCRKKLSMQRLLTAGMRGFYVIGKHGKPRYLHVAEAAYICSILPTMVFPHGPRKSLCLIGQCAAPLQAMWMLGHFLDSLGINQYGNTLGALKSYQQHLMREAHGKFQFDLKPFDTMVFAGQNDPPIPLKVTPGETISSLCQAESKLLEPGWHVAVHDDQGTLAKESKLQVAPLVGNYRLETRIKKQKKECEKGVIQLNFLIGVGQEVKMVGGRFIPVTFLFEAAALLGLSGTHHLLQDAHGALHGLDERAWSSMLLTGLNMFQAEGIAIATPIGGLSDFCIDVMATWLIRQASKERSCFWMPAAMATVWFHDGSDDWLDHWALAALHGRLFMAIAINRHWILLEAFYQDGLLQVIYMDGQEHQEDAAILQFALRLGKLVMIAPVSLTKNQLFTQISCQTCGTVALLHLGERLGLWTDVQHPDELDWHRYLFQFFPEGILTAEGKGGQTDDRDLIWMLRDILREHGVPDDRTEERARAALDKIGATRLRDAVQSRNPWQALKALGSQPRVNFMFVKPDELERQIRQRAQSKFKVHSADKKNKLAKPKLEGSDVDPSQLKLIEDTFILQDKDTPVQQLQMSEVATHRAGLAFGRIAEVLPFIREGKSLSLDGLAVLTTSKIPPSEQGLLPVINLKFPAIYVPTQELILLEGSLVNLGDLTIVRKQEMELIETVSIGTGVLKLTQYKDEWTQDWALLLKAPLKTILQQHPLFTVCSGQRCGGNCPRYHPPVDVELEAVVLDVWARAWLSLRGKRVDQENADLFQVLIRVPECLVKPLQRLSGTAGLYMEPRQSEGKGADQNSSVIWLPNCNLAEAQHKMKITEHACAIARFGGRYGIRVPAREAEHIHSQLNPEVPFASFEVHKTFELRPLPHGTQRLGVLSMLKAWRWKARPLQPCKADSNGMGWIVGAAEDPPSMIIPTKAGDVMISLHKAHGDGEGGSTLTSSARTQGHLRKQQKEERKGVPPSQGHSKAQASSSAMTTSEADPWIGNDPWGGWRSTAPNQDEPMHVKAMAESLEERVTTGVMSANEERFQKLEVDIAEIRQQNRKHEQWFQEAGAANQRLQTQVGTLSTQLAQNQQEVTSLSAEIKMGFQSMEALLSKKQRTDC
jgi:hypothetical protein